MVQTAPVVTTDPLDQTVAPGDDATFIAAASGSPTPSVHWQVDTGSGFTDLPGETATTLSLVDVTTDLDGNQYRAVFTNPAGTATSATATLTVTEVFSCPTGTSPTVTCDPKPGGGYVMTGTGADETFVGSPGPDTMVGAGGDDVMRGARGADLAKGNAGGDVLKGGRGPDELRGGRAADRLHGGPGRDLLYGGPGLDELNPRAAAGYGRTSRWWWS